MVLVGTGIFLALYYSPGDAQVIYHGPYALLNGEQMSEAYRSVLDLSFSVPAGLLFRQVHHWAADVFIAAIVLHLVRIFFTGAYRKPRDLNYYIGLTMLMLAILEGFAGYSLVDDLLSGMGLAIAYSVAFAIPGIGAQLGYLVWGGPFPGSSSFLPAAGDRPRVPAPAGADGADHRPPGDDHAPAPLAVPRARAGGSATSSARRCGRRTRCARSGCCWPWPRCCSCSAGWSRSTRSGSGARIHPYLSENGAQPDWYIGWLIGALRLMPNFEPAIGNHTLIPNPFWGGAAFPLLVFAVMFAWPWLERRVTGDQRRHDLLDRPRDRPVRTAIGAAFLSWVVIIFAVGSTDRLFYRLGISYPGQIHFWRVGVFVLPVDRVLPHPQRLPFAAALLGAPTARLAG